MFTWDALPRGPVSVATITCKLPASCIGWVAASLRANEQIQAKDPGPSSIFAGRFQGRSSLRLGADGTLQYEHDPELKSMLVQAVRGGLPEPPARIMVGIDEAGIGGESAQAHVAVVAIGEEARAELLVDGVRDSKDVGSPAELTRLASVVQGTAALAVVVPVDAPEAGHGYARKVATTAGTVVARWLDEGTLHADVHVRLDASDEAAFFEALGDYADLLVGQVLVTAKAEQHVEVACAGILATSAAKAAGPPPVAKRPKPQMAGLFRVGPHRAQDREQVLEHVRSLEYAYPDIARWIGKEGSVDSLWSKIEAGKQQLTVARVDDEVVGFCIYGLKDERNAKISTFYVVRRWRRRHIGHGILQDVLRQLARAGCRRAAVTFAHEEFFEMQGFFTRYGFTLDGISPQRYRDDSYEVIMGKRFVRERLTQRDFPGFVEHVIFRMQGFDTVSVGEGTFIARPRLDLFALHRLPSRRNLLVQVTEQKDPESLLANVVSLAASHDAQPVLVSLQGWPAHESLPSNALVLDAQAICNLFYPMDLEQPDGQDLIIPIMPEYAERLMQAKKQLRFHAPKLGLRFENVYYRKDDGRRNMRRGARLFFYESGGRGIFGMARLNATDSGPAKTLYARYGGMGAWSREEIEKHTKGKPALAYRFEWFEELPRAVPPDKVKQIRPQFNPITVVNITQAQGDMILEAAKP